MTQAEILAMKPGAELNMMVAEQVIGHQITKDSFFGHMERLVDPEDGSSVWSMLQPYSEDISVAEAVVDRMIDLGHEDAIYWADFGEGAYTEAEAICKAALLAMS